ncbi:PREDICTED: RNA polymerase II transcriptional coactivator KELP [Nicotiana attenuata]|uniref:Rna polymerase ii transcriptional coactivator kelp n=1 Tax=Nicotiana attenuata TaxID=49451 RepID=A0A314KM30_NICAT|nr:PREDICTED: RNA polymerase II transcriptional coactivator KELP [Nicotiana attenuata]OIT30350.1 rna polymerase ii transcriptional coactivator kelp [Nicotiana attenuata]
MDSETSNKIEETVLEILKSCNLDEVTELKIRKMASEKLGLELSDPTRKAFVRQVVEKFLAEEQAKAEANEEEEEEEEEEEDNKKKSSGAGDKEYDDDGDLIVCRLSHKRRVTITEFRGKTLVSIREYYNKDGKELPTAKGISLTAEQWATFNKNIPAVEKAIKKMESRA